MKVLLFHGYLLRGTGSNVYTAEVARAFLRSGDEVHVICQDRDPPSLPWVDSWGDWDSGALTIQQREGLSGPPKAFVYRPPISMLAVYVADVYEGIEAKTYPDMTPEQVGAYLDVNVKATQEVLRKVSPDVVLAGHLLAGPVVLARALAGTGRKFVSKVHGSSLEYTVKKFPDRFLGLAQEGMAASCAVLVGSRHTAESLWAAVGDSSLSDRTFLGPPGVDIERFSPREPQAALEGFRALKARLAPKPGEVTGAPTPGGSTFAVIPGEAHAALSKIKETGTKKVVYVGKHIVAKGVQLLLAAWPLVLAAHPDAELIVVGFGEGRKSLEALASALEAGDLTQAAAVRGEFDKEMPHVASFIAELLEKKDLRDAYLEAAQKMKGSYVFPGLLNHLQLADLLPLCEAIVVPSTFPEAFGMVAAEGAAAGCFPVCANHSGLAEVARSLAVAIPEQARPWLTFEVGPGAVPALAANLASWLTASGDVRTAVRAGLVAKTRDKYSWDGLARTITAASGGDLSELSKP